MEKIVSFKCSKCNLLHDTDNGRKCTKCGVNGCNACVGVWYTSEIKSPICGECYRRYSAERIAATRSIDTEIGEVAFSRDKKITAYRNVQNRLANKRIGELRKKRNERIEEFTMEFMTTEKKEKVGESGC